MVDENGDKLWTIREIAEMLNLDRVAVWLRRRKVGVGRLVGGVWVFTASEVEAIKDAPDGRRKGAGDAQ